MNRISLRLPAWCALAAMALLLAACGGSGGKVQGWFEKAEGECAVPKTALSHGLAYVDTSMMEHGQPAKIEIVLSDTSLDKVDIEGGFDPLFGGKAGSRQLYVITSVPFHGLSSGEFVMVHPTKPCGTNMQGSKIAFDLTTLSAERVAFKASPRPGREGESGPRDAAQIEVDLSVKWPKSAPPELRELLAKEYAARLQYEREALALYDELLKAVAARDVAGVEQRVLLEGWSSFGSLLEEMVFGEPGANEEAKKLLPTVAALKPASWLYTREATKPGGEWELKLALCDPADATRRGTVDVKRLADGRWVATDTRDADDAVNEFGPAPAACTPVRAPTAPAAAP